MEDVKEEEEKEGTSSGGMSNLEKSLVGDGISNGG